MRLNRHQVGASAIRLLSVTAAAATACALWAGTASAATASVAKHSTTTSISISPKSQWVGPSVKLSAKVSSSGGSRARGTVTFKWGTVKLCSGRLALGATHCRVAFLRAGTYAIRAYYNGNATHKTSFSTPARVHVLRSPTVTKITNKADGTVDVGKSFTINVTVGSAVGAPAASGSVKVTATSPAGLPASYSCIAPVSGGKGSCAVTPTEYGIVTYAATFVGNAAFRASTYAGPYDLAAQNVTATTVAAPSAKAGDVTLTATVTAGGANISATNGGTGSVAFYVNGTVVTDCAAQLLAFTGGTNVATCTANAALNKLKAGTTYDVTAVFSGDPTNVRSTSPDFSLTPTT